MNKIEYLLTCLAEECDEVSQRAHKAQRFSLPEIQKGQSQTNAERISEELKDLISIGYWLEDLGVLPRFLPTKEEVTTKKLKVQRYSNISVDNNVLEEVIDVI